jgi:hypothetical protein
MQAQQDRVDKALKAMLTQKQREIELLKIRIEVEVNALNDLLKVRNSFTLFSSELQLLSFFIINTCDNSRI